MSQTQKEAWFNLIVIVLCIGTVLALYPFLGRGAAGGFGVLGFLGFGPLFFRRRGDRILADERDHFIQRRSTIFAYSVFWIAFVAASMLALKIYGGDGAVPVPIIMNAVWVALILVVGLRSLATLAQYGWGVTDARSQ